MIEVTMKISTENATFQDDYIGQVDDILQQLSREIDRCVTQGIEKKIIRPKDWNGNIVGKITIVVKA